MAERSGQRLQRAELLERRARGSARRVLVVEDDPTLAIDIQRQLERSGHDVVVAHTAETAIEMAGATACDVVVIDSAFAGSIDGNDVARTIHDTLATPIVFVARPFDARELADRLRDAFTG